MISAKTFETSVAHYQTIQRDQSERLEY